MEPVTPSISQFSSITASKAANMTYEANEEAINEAIRTLDDMVSKASKEGRVNYVRST